MLQYNNATQITLLLHKNTFFLNLTCDSFSAVLSAESDISAVMLPLPLEAAMSTKLFPSPLEIVMSEELFPLPLVTEIVSFVDVRKSFDTVISGD